MPSATVKGKLTWYYRRSEETAPLAKTKFTPPSGKFSIGSDLKSSDAVIADAAFKDPSFVAAVKPTVLAILMNNGGRREQRERRGNGVAASRGRQSMISLASLKSVGPTAPIVPSTTAQISQQLPFAVSVVGGGLNSAFNSNNPALFNDQGNEAHPMSNTVIKLLAVDTTQPSAAGAPQLVGTGVTDDQGNFQLSFIPPASFGSGKGYKYSLSVQNNYFAMPALSFSMPAGASSYDPGRSERACQYLPSACLCR